VIEVVSPSTADPDRGVKLERYRHYGVPEYWMVDPDQTTIEHWRFGSTVEREIPGPGDELRWTPAGAGKVLSIDVDEILGE
jgi:Uma2 family endonuclease